MAINGTVSAPLDLPCAGQKDVPQAHHQRQQDVTKDGTVFLQGIKNGHLRQKAQKEHRQSIQGHLGCGILSTLQSSF